MVVSKKVLMRHVAKQPEYDPREEVMNKLNETYGNIKLDKLLEDNRKKNVAFEFGLSGGDVHGMKVENMYAVKNVKDLINDLLERMRLNYDLIKTEQDDEKRAFLEEQNNLMIDQIGELKREAVSLNNKLSSLPEFIRDINALELDKLRDLHKRPIVNLRNETPVHAYFEHARAGARYRPPSPHKEEFHRPEEEEEFHRPEEEEESKSKKKKIKKIKKVKEPEEGQRDIRRFMS
jgi:hypothetical protein